jgi:putative addiction module killer protein
MKLEDCLNARGKSPFTEWYADLDPIAAAKVSVALIRMEQGNFSNVKAVGEGVSEYKINFGPGYRIYFAMDGNTLIILLGGGTKTRQQQDIEAAKDLWQHYKAQKKRP